VDSEGAIDGLGGESYLYLSTTGRRSGRPHEIEIWFGLEGRTAYLLSGGGEGADWVRNLRAAPACRARIAAREFTALGRILERGPGEDERARRALYEKYQPGYSGDLAEWRDSALVVALDLAVPEA
jgi:deazaflavin-dependent oxidoreductase (nitroreductase family)